MNNPFDKLKQDWQNQSYQPLNMEQLLKEAAWKKKRMVLFFFGDIVCTMAAILYSIHYLTTHQELSDIVFAVFLVAAVSFAMAVSVWSKRGLWGSEQLDIRSTIKLSINRSEAGVDLANYTYIFIIVMFAFMYSWRIWVSGGFDFLPLTKHILILLNFLAFMFGTAWYKRKQQKNVAAYKAQLKALNQMDDEL